MLENTISCYPLSDATTHKDLTEVFNEAAEPHCQSVITGPYRKSNRTGQEDIHILQDWSAQSHQSTLICLPFALLQSRGRFSGTIMCCFLDELKATLLRHYLAQLKNSRKVMCHSSNRIFLK